MGYELDRLMRQYGVSTPSVRYEGAQMPTRPADAPAHYTNEQKAAFYADNANGWNAYNAQLPKAERDRALFNAWSGQYANRMANTDMYGQSQFGRAPTQHAGILGPLNYANPDPALLAAAQPSGQGGQFVNTSGATGGMSGAPTNANSTVLSYLSDGFLDSNERASIERMMATSGSAAPFRSAMDYYDPSGATWGAFANAPVGTAPLNTPASGGSSAPPSITPVTPEMNNYLPQGLFGGNTPVILPGSAPAPAPAPIAAPTPVPAPIYEAPYVDPLFPVQFGEGVSAPQSFGYARGGSVRRHYQVGGGVELANPTELPEITIPLPADSTPPGAGVQVTPMGAPGAPMGEAAPPSPSMAPEPIPVGPSGIGARPASPLDALLAKYTAPESLYAGELAAARKKAAADAAAFDNILQRALSEKSTDAPSKAELYFRLAAAFGAPTRTGNFGETIANVNKELAEHAKDTRAAEKADRAAKLQLGITAAKSRADASKEDLGTLRALAGEEMKDRRAVTTKLLEEYVKSGQPQSSAGKQAADEGLVPGTPEFQKRVSEIAQANIEGKLAQITAALSGVQVAQQGLALQQDRFRHTVTESAKLTPAELKLKTDTEDSIAGADQALANLRQAFALNPKTFDNSLRDRGVRVLLENVNSDDPKVVATRTMENLLAKGALEKLRGAFGGNPTEGERKILLELEGIGAKSKAERAEILMNAYSALQTARTRSQKRLNEINTGLYRNTTPAQGIAE